MTAKPRLKPVQNANRQLRILRSIIEGMAEGVAVGDRNGKLILFNSVAKHLLGYNVTKESKDTWQDFYGLYHSDRVTPVETEDLPMVRALNGFDVNGLILYVKNKRKPEGLFIRANARPLWDRKGRKQGGVVVFQDITEEKMAVDALKASEENLRIAKTAAEEANRAKSEFLANISHEIRTPLAALLGYSELLLEPSLLSDQQRQWLEALQRNGRHLFSLVEGILDLSKIESGNLPMPLSTFELRREIETTLLALRHQSDKKGLDLGVVYRGEIPRKIRSSPRGLRQILINVLGNAIKFTETGEVTLTISMEGTQLALSISDTGIGIEPKEESKLFKPFSQADSSAQRRFGGTGLGLALSRRMARSLGGDLVLERSVPGQGTTFKLTLFPGPVHLMDGASGLENTLPPEPILSDARLEGISLLVVEDSYDNQVLLRHFLERAGAKVHVVDDGFQALLAVEECGYDLVLMDIQLPGLDGCRATQELRRRKFQNPIIALTAHALENERLRCLEAGCDDYLTKPVDPNLLVRTVARFGSVAGLGALWTGADGKVRFNNSRKPVGKIQKGTVASPGHGNEIRVK